MDIVAEQTVTPEDTWPSSVNRNGIDRRLHLPMDMPVHMNLHDIKFKEGEPHNTFNDRKAYVLDIEARPWGRNVIVRFQLDGTLKVFVKDAEGVELLYEGERNDSADRYHK